MAELPTAYGCIACSPHYTDRKQRPLPQINESLQTLNPACRRKDLPFLGTLIMVFLLNGKSFGPQVQQTPVPTRKPEDPLLKPSILKLWSPSLSLSLSLSLTICISIHLFVYLSVYLSTKNISIYLPIYLSIYLSIHPYIYIYVYIHTHTHTYFDFLVFPR